MCLEQLEGKRENPATISEDEISIKLLHRVVKAVTMINSLLIDNHPLLGSTIQAINQCLH